MPEKKEEICEHSWLPLVVVVDDQVFGLEEEEEEEVFLGRSFIIVSCSDCCKKGYVIAEKL